VNIIDGVAAAPSTTLYVRCYAPLFPDTRDSHQQYSMGIKFENSLCCKLNHERHQVGLTTLISAFAILPFGPVQEFH
jgi:hypothetical protein